MNDNETEGIIYKGDDPETYYLNKQHSRVMFILLLLALTFAAMIAALCLGAVDIPFLTTFKVVINSFTGHIFGDVPSAYERIIMTLRMPRVFLCMLTGASLGMAGLIMQGLLRNPLVSPFTLGVSTASSFGAALAIVFGTAILGDVYYESIDLFDQDITVDIVLKTVMAFIFGLASVSLVLMLTRNTKVSRSTVILSGVIISYMFQAGIMFSKYVSDDSQLRDITMWMMGGLSGASWGSILIVLPIALIGAIYLEKLTVDINLLSSGDDVATNLGVNVSHLRNTGLIVSTLITSICIAFTGTIGFIGLMAPHLCRMIMGNDTRYLLPASALMGSFILLISDTVSRLILRPSELPVGIMMYIIGGIFFIWLVCGKRLGDRV